MKRAFLLAAALLLGCTHGPHREPGTIAERTARYEGPGRLAWQRPDEVVRALGLPPDAVVADLGVGSGYFAVRLARAVPRGRVIGLDIEPDFVALVNERARREGLPNLEARLVAPDDPGLGPGSVDLVLSRWSSSTWRNTGASDAGRLRTSAGSPISRRNAFYSGWLRTVGSP